MLSLQRDRVALHGGFDQAPERPRREKRFITGSHGMNGIWRPRPHGGQGDIEEILQGLGSQHSG
jgi:hypothetical protein